MGQASQNLHPDNNPEKCSATVLVHSDLRVKDFRARVGSQKTDQFLLLPNDMDLVHQEMILLGRKFLMRLKEQKEKQ